MQPGVNELTLRTAGLKTGQYVISVSEGSKRVFDRKNAGCVVYGLRPEYLSAAGLTGGGP